MQWIWSIRLVTLVLDRIKVYPEMRRLSYWQSVLKHSVRSNNNANNNLNSPHKQNKKHYNLM